MEWSGLIYIIIRSDKPSRSEKMSDNFKLTRPDHQTSLAGSIQEETEFCDVTLACEDQQVRAHKVVLAASSPKLRNILLSNPHHHPLIYMNGVKFSVLENIVKFIYQGEVVIRSDQVNSFVDVAQDFQVKGLTKTSGETQTRSDVSTSNRKDETKDTRNYQERQEEDNNSNIPSIQYFSDPLGVVEEEKEGEEDLQEEQVVRPELGNLNTEDIVEDDVDGDNWTLPDGQDGDTGVEKNRICPHCQRGFLSPSLLEIHIRSHTKEKPFSCQLCSIAFSRNCNLVRHVKTVHMGERAYKCPQCDRAFTSKRTLLGHIKIKHQD